MRAPALIVLSILATGCASTKELPIPTGTPVRINSAAEVQAMLDEAGIALIGPRKDEVNVRNYFMHEPMRLLSRQPDPDDFERLGAALVEKTVIIRFQDGATEFVPTGSERFHIRQLAAVASRVALRGRTSSETSTNGTMWVATERAVAVKRYLLDIGFPSDRISINVMGAGDFVASSRTTEGRALNRRVEIEFIFEGARS